MHVYVHARTNAYTLEHIIICTCTHTHTHARARAHTHTLSLLNSFGNKVILIDLTQKVELYSLSAKCTCLSEGKNNSRHLYSDNSRALAHGRTNQLGEV